MTSFAAKVTPAAKSALACATVSVILLSEASIAVMPTEANVAICVSVKVAIFAPVSDTATWSSVAKEICAVEKALA